MTTKPKRKGLQHVFQFDTDDLEANRSGAMSNAQQQILKDRFHDGYKLYVLIAVHSIILLVALLYTWFTQQNNTFYMEHSGGALWLSIGITIIMIVVFGALVWQHHQIIRRETHSGSIREVSGICQLEPPDRTRLTAILHIDDEIFKLSPDEATAFESGKSYRIYVSPQTRQILSAERA